MQRYLRYVRIGFSVTCGIALGIRIAACSSSISVCFSWAPPLDTLTLAHQPRPATDRDNDGSRRARANNVVDALGGKLLAQVASPLSRSAISAICVVIVALSVIRCPLSDRCCRMETRIE